MVHKSRCNCKAKVNYAGGLLPYSSGYYAHNVLSGMLGYIEPCSLFGGIMRAPKDIP